MESISFGHKTCRQDPHIMHSFCAHCGKNPYKVTMNAKEVAIQITMFAASNRVVDLLLHFAVKRLSKG